MIPAALIRKWASRAALHIAAQAVGILIVPAAVLAARGRDRLPSWAWPWDNPGAPTGDRYWLARPWVQRHPTFARIVWLGWRNRANGLSAAIGVPTERIDSYATCEDGDPRYANDDRRWTGSLKAYAWDGDQLVAFELYGVKRYPWSRSIGIRWRIGWKIKGHTQEDNPHRLVLSIQPLRKIES